MFRSLLRSLTACTVTLVTLSGALAKPAPTTAPATTQSSIATDQTTPRGAFKVLTVAMNKGDAASIKSVFAPSTPTETKMVDAVVDQQAAMIKFHDAAVTAFGGRGQEASAG